jgi:hypothetical protein
MMESDGAAKGAPPVTGTCGLCGKPTKRNQKEFGRCVASLEEPLRKAVEGYDVVCDGCLRKKQPLRRTDKQWARELRDRAPLCARNGWRCPLQDHETKVGKKKHTETLKPDGLNEYYREKMGIREYAAVNSVCKLCYDQFSNSKMPVAVPKTPSAATTPQPSTGKSSLKRKQEQREQVTEKDLVEALVTCPDFVRNRVAALISHVGRDLNASQLRELLCVSKCGTYNRAARALAEGADPEDIFQVVRRGRGLQVEEVNKLVVSFLRENSVEANTGCVRKRDGEQHRYLQDTLRTLLCVFRSTHPSITMSLGRFANVRKEHAGFIKFAADQKSPHAGCLYCNNFRFRLDALRRKRQRLRQSVEGFPKVKDFPTYSGNVFKDFLCVRDGQPYWAYIPCVLGTCKDCGFAMRTALCQREKRDKIKLKYFAWEREPDGYRVWHVAEQEEVTAKELWTTTQVYCDKKCPGGKSWLRHVLTARVPHEARRELLGKLAPTDAFVGVDYSSQFEFTNPFTIPQATHVAKKAHILVVYVAQPESRTNRILEDDEDEDDVAALIDRMEGLIIDDDVSDEGTTHVKYETFFFVSESKSRGHLQYGLKKVLDYLNVGNPGGTERVFLQSDGEFRNRYNLWWLGSEAQDRMVDTFWSFYGANHGKDLYDSEGGVFKCAARAHVMRKGNREHNPISDIKDLVDFGKRELADPDGKVQRRHFFEVDDSEVVQPPEAEQVKGSRSLYAYRVRGSTGSNLVEARPFACYCDGCIRFAECHRPGGPWRGTPAGVLTQAPDSSDMSE